MRIGGRNIRVLKFHHYFSRSFWRAMRKELAAVRAEVKDGEPPSWEAVWRHHDRIIRSLDDPSPFRGGR